MVKKRHVVSDAPTEVIVEAESAPKKLRLTQPLTTESEEVQRDHLLWHTYDIPTDEDRQEVIDFIIQDLSSPRSMRQLADEGLLISAQCLAVLAEQGLKEAQLNSIVSITSHAQHPDILCALILTLQHAAVSNPDFKEQCLAVTHSLVTSQQFQVPVIVACLSLVGSVLSSNDDDRLIQLWNRLWLHPDARVRMSVLKSAMNAVKIGYEPNIVMYHRSIRLFSDDFEGVRAAAVEFVCLFADKIPLHDIPAPEDPSSNITLVEHAFNAACEMVTDISLKVRTCAVLQIGKLQHVTGSILELTLEQQLMSHLRKKNTSKERRSALVLSGGWATGRRWGDDSPAEFVDTANVSLVKRGACGAFVNGLEDESMQVRIGTVSAISSLARCNVAFAMKSLDSLVDMLNDEIEEVRQSAIEALKVVSAHCVIREDQLEDILSGLDDLSVSIREGIHDLLSVCTLHNKECMRAALQALLRNLKKYTKDKESIWCALHHLGDRHYNLCLPLMDEFLCLHPFFDTVEPNIEDPAYIAVAILVINSAAKCPTLPALFPRFMLQHYNYLRDSLPALIPTLKIEDTNFRYVPMEKPSLPTSRRDTALTLYSEVRSCLTEVLSLPERFRLQMFPRLLRDLAQLKSSHLAGDASFIGMFIRVHRTYDASMAVLRQIGPSAQIELPMEGTVEAGRQMFQHIISMETRFAGLTADEKWRLRQSRVKIAAIVLLLELFKNNASSESQTKLCTYFLSSLMQLRSLNVDSFTSGLISQLSNVEPQKVGLISKYLRYLLLHAKSLDLFFPTNMLSRASAKIISPSSSDSIQRFAAGLILSLKVEVDIFAVEDTDLIRIVIVLPDKKRQICAPAADRFSKVPSFDASNSNSTALRLRTDVGLSHHPWTEAGEISLLICLSAVPLLTALTQSSISTPTREKLLPISEPVKLQILPKFKV